MNQHDLRVIKTRNNIRNAFLTLLQQKDFGHIIVQDILDQALINRTTFYKHYKDKYELAEIMCKEMQITFNEQIDTRFKCHNENEVIIAVQNLYKNLQKQSEEILALWNIHTETIHLYEDMLNYLKQSFLVSQKANHRYSDNMIEYFALLYASEVMVTIKWCLQTDDFVELLDHLDIFQELGKIIFSK